MLLYLAMVFHRNDSQLRQLNNPAATFALRFDEAQALARALKGPAHRKHVDQTKGLAARNRGAMLD